MRIAENFWKGVLKENPVLISLLALCPTLAITTKVENAFGMGIAVLFVLTLSNIIISLIKGFIPNEIRIPIYIVVIATLVSLVDMLMKAYLPDLHESLGIFIPLIVVNCMILGRAEAFASRNTTVDSIFDALGMTLGYFLVLFVVSFFREFLGTGAITIWGEMKLDLNVLLNNGEPFKFFAREFFIKAPGAFIVLGLLVGFTNMITNRKVKKEVK